MFLACYEEAMEQLKSIEEGTKMLDKWFAEYLAEQERKTTPISFVPTTDIQTAAIA